MQTSRGMTSLRDDTTSIPLIVGFRISQLYGSRLEQACREIASTVFAETPAECRSIVGAHAGAVVIVEVPTTDPPESLEWVEDLASDFPLTVWVALFIDGRSSLTALARLGAAGVTRVLPAHAANEPASVRRCLADGSWAVLPERVWQAAKLRVPFTAEPVVMAAVKLAHAPFSVVQLALACGVHERTLRKHCTQYGMPSPQWIVGWARCLVAAFFLDEPSRKVTSIEKLLGFAAPGALSTHLKRYTGKTAQSLRQERALDTVARKLESALTALSEHHDARRDVRHANGQTTSTAMCRRH